MNEMMYILSTGCQWRYLPKDFPPRSTVHNNFIWWHCDGVLDRIHHALYIECREQAEREGSPTAFTSSIVKASRATKKGGPHRSARLRCRHELDQGQEAAYSRRYAGSVAARASFIPPASRIAMAASCCWQRCSVSFHSLRSCLPTAPIKGRSSATRSPKSCLASKPKSSNDPIRQKASCSCPSVGSSNARSPGSTAAAASPRTGKISTAAPSRS